MKKIKTRRVCAGCYETINTAGPNGEFARFYIEKSCDMPGMWTVSAHPRNEVNSDYSYTCESKGSAIEMMEVINARYTKEEHPDWFEIIE